MADFFHAPNGLAGRLIHAGWRIEKRTEFLFVEQGFVGKVIGQSTRGVNSIPYYAQE
jgi:hypothetical protein